MNGPRPSSADWQSAVSRSGTPPPAHTMSTQTLLFFEQAQVDAEQAAIQAELDAARRHREEREAQRALEKRQRELRKAEEESAKSHRRFQRDMARRYREPDEHAQCGIRWYCRSPRDRDRGSYWHHCHACGQALIHTTDRNAKPQQCAGRKP